MSDLPTAVAASQSADSSTSSSSAPTSPSPVIRPEDIQLDDDARIGGRQMSQGKWRKRLIMVKVLSKQAEPEELQARGELWTSLRHPNVLQTFGISPLDADPLYVVTQFQPDGNVAKYLQAHPDVDRSKIIIDVALGMQYLHGRGVVHGSMKPANILIMVNGKACISDYGMIEIQTSGSYRHRYFSPEAWKGTLSRPSDVFAWAMCALEIFTSKAPWGILSEKQIFRLVVRQDSRPDRPDEDYGLTDHIWRIFERCWVRDARQRPTFDAITQLLLGSVRISAVSPTPRPPEIYVLRHDDPERHMTPSVASGSSDRLTAPVRSGSPPSRVASVISVPPAYEPFNSMGGSGAPLVPASAPASLPQFRNRYQPPPIEGYPSEDEEDEDFVGLRPSQAPRGIHRGRGRLAPSLSIRTNSSSGGSAHSGWTSSSGGSSRGGANRANTVPIPNHLLLRNATASTTTKSIKSIDEETGAQVLHLANEIPPRASPAPEGPRSLPVTPAGKATAKMPPADLIKAYTQEKVRVAALISPSEYSESSASTASMSDAIAPSIVQSTDAMSIRSVPSTTSTATAPNANLLAGALLMEVKEGQRKAEIIDPLLAKIYLLGRRSERDAQKLVTAGTIPTLIILLKARAVDGVGLEKLLVALGILIHDPITANTIYRTGASMTLMQIVESAQDDELIALAIWCLSRICRNAEIAKGLLQQGLGKLLVKNGLRGGQKPARLAAWCLGTLVCTDNIAEMLAEAGFANALCDHLRRCTGGAAEWDVLLPEDQCAALYAVARISRAIKIAKMLAKGGSVDALARLLFTSNDPDVLRWTARAVGCLMRPNSADIARMLLDAGVARGLARLPSVLKPEEVEPLGSFAFAIQRFSCAEWGGGTRKALVDAGSVDALLAALRTAAVEPYPQVHIELAYAIALLSDVGGTAIRKEIVTAGGIEILKQVGHASGRNDVQKACNLAATSVTGGTWSRNAASAKAALVHEWSGGCPEFYPICPVSAEVVDVQ